MEIFIKSLILGLSIAMPVGPIGMICIKSSLKHGFRIGIAVGLGAALADSFYGFLASGGLAFISQFLLDYSNSIKVIGGLTLIYFGAIEIKQTKVFVPATPNQEVRISTDSGFYQTIFTSFLLTLSNPATLIFVGGILFSAFLGRKVNIYTIPLGVFIGSMIWWLILAGLVSAIRHKVSQKVMIIIRVFSAIILISFGIYNFISLDYN